MKKFIIKGKVWSGFHGEYKKPPIYIIFKPGSDGIFIDDIFRKYLRKEVYITIKEIKKGANNARA